MQDYLLNWINNHLMVEIGADQFLLDTGSPISLGTDRQVSICGNQFDLFDNYLGLSPEMLSGYIDYDINGLLGMDILSKFDIEIDLPTSQISIGKIESPDQGCEIPLEFVMGIPVMQAGIGDRQFRTFFDTGAYISYLQDEIRKDFPEGEVVDDFYPGFGEFETETNQVPWSIGDISFNMQTGVLPGLLGTTFLMTGVQGIIGNQILVSHRAQFLPQEDLLIILQQAP